MALQFRRLRSSTVREVIAQGNLPELEYGLLRRHAEKLRWGTADKARFCNMAIDELEYEQGDAKLQVIVRFFCFSKDVTPEHITIDERFNVRQCVLLVGDVGRVPAPWACLIQPAVWLHARDFNVLCIEIPDFATNASKWLTSGPAILRGALKFLGVNSVNVLACGIGGAVFLEALAQSRQQFGKTHFIFNLDCPPTKGQAPFPISTLEELLRESELQLWFGYNDEPNVFNRRVDGTPRRSFEAISGMPQRLEDERRDGKRYLDYDEVLMTGHLNATSQQIKRLPIGRNVLIVFSDALLTSLAQFFENPPGQCQSEMVDGLVLDMKRFAWMKPGEELPELPALRALRLPTPSNENVALTLGRRSEALPLMPAAQAALPPPAKAMQRQLAGSASAPALRRALGDATGPGPGGALLKLDPARRSILAVSVEYLRERQSAWNVLGAD